MLVQELVEGSRWSAENSFDRSVGSLRVRDCERLDLDEVIDQPVGQTLLFEASAEFLL